MIGSRQEKAGFQSDFYRDQYRKMLRWLMGAVFIMYVLIAAIIYLILHEVPRSYYANTTEGKILDMPAYVHNAK